MWEEVEDCEQIISGTDQADHLTKGDYRGASYSEKSHLLAGIFSAIHFLSSKQWLLLVGLCSLWALIVYTNNGSEVIAAAKTILEAIK